MSLGLLITIVGLCCIFAVFLWIGSFVVMMIGGKFIQDKTVDLLGEAIKKGTEHKKEDEH